MVLNLITIFLFNLSGVRNMNDCINQSRRNMLKLGSIAVVMIPAVAFAAKNDALRTAMKYKESPEGDKKCSTCLQFVPGKTANALGGCKVFAGDTEISPNGYCSAWVKKA
jgi:hypothetical protein